MYRFSFIMALLSLTFWICSGPYFYRLLGIESVGFPNCLSARVDSNNVAIGCLSHCSTSTIFVTNESIEPGRAVWSERSDGHFCGFPIPTTYTQPKGGFCVMLSPTAIGWDFPYWMMTLLWALMTVKEWHRFRFRIREMLVFTAIVSLVTVAIRLRVALLWVVFLNLATAVLLLLFAGRALHAFWKMNNPWWPFLVENQGQEMAGKLDTKEPDE